MILETALNSNMEQITQSLFLFKIDMLFFEHFKSIFAANLKEINYKYSCSGIYKTKTQLKNLGQFEFVLKVLNKDSAENISKNILNVFKDFEQVECTLLSHGGNISWSPKVLLPHPDLINDQTALICAAELCPDYFHPILKKTLIQILDEKDEEYDAEFFGSSRTLLD